MKYLRVYDTKQDGTPCLNAYGEFSTRDRAIADVVYHEREPKAHRVEPVGDYLQRLNRDIREAGK